MNYYLLETFLTYKDSNFFVNNNIVDDKITNPSLHLTVSLKKSTSFAQFHTTH